MDFKTSIQNILKLEGKFSDDKDDPGGATGWGILQLEYNTYRQSLNLPTQDIKNITPDEAEAIYQINYWLPLRCPELGNPLDFAIFQWGVNGGVVTAIKTLQRTMMVNADGIFGPLTMQAVKTFNPENLTEAFLREQMGHYDEIIASHQALKVFEKGWHNRVLQTALICNLPKEETQSWGIA